MYSSARSMVCRRAASSRACRVGHSSGDRHRMLGTRAPGDHRLECCRVEAHFAVEPRLRIARQGSPVRQRRVPERTLRREGAAREVGECRVVGRHHAGAGPCFDRHIADGETLLDAHGPEHRSGVLDDVTDRAAGADLRDDREDHVLGADAFRPAPVDGDAHRPRRRLPERLRGEHVLDSPTDRSRTQTRRARRASKYGCRRRPGRARVA